MKRTVVNRVLLILSTLISLVFLLFAFAQKVEADKQRVLAQEQQALAMQRIGELQRQLDECRSK